MESAPETQISIPHEPINRGQSDAILDARAGEMRANDEGGVVADDGGRRERQMRSKREGEGDELAGGS